MRVVKRNGNIIEDCTALASTDAVMFGALVAGAGALIASTSLYGNADKPLKQQVNSTKSEIAKELGKAPKTLALPTEGRAVAETIQVSEPSSPEAEASLVEARSRATDSSAVQPIKPRKKAPIFATIEHRAPLAVSSNALIHMPLPAVELRPQALRETDPEPRPALAMPVHSANAAQHMRLPEPVMADDAFSLAKIADQDEPLVAEYQRAEPALVSGSAPMVVVAKLDLPAPQLIEVEREPIEIPVLASEQPTVAESFAVAQIDLPAPGRQLADSAPVVPPHPARVPEAAPLASKAVLVATMPDIEKQLSYAAGFDLGTAKLDQKDDVPVAGAIDVEKTLFANGRKIGKVPLRIDAHSTVAIRLGDLLSLFRDDMNSRNYAALEGSSKANTYVSFRRLRAAGFAVTYDPVSDSVSLNLDG